MQSFYLYPVMKNVKLFMLLLGCKPEGRNTEQHDVFFAIGDSLKSLIPDIQLFWPEAKSKIHIDAWREVTQVGGFSIEITSRNAMENLQGERLFFVNLGGYRSGEFEEYHYKLLSVNTQKAGAIDHAKDSIFYQQKYSAHIDDKYGVDVDDIYDVEDILPAYAKEKYALQILPGNGNEDVLNIGYYKLSAL